ncbi:MAG: adenine phosphoribosyltransferase [Thermoplasmata archaeon]|jgi:adenine phosphoribosyltransferase|nr:adenine phosphoribosyltransferase [Thermoplasmata archaeon]
MRAGSRAGPAKKAGKAIRVTVRAKRKPGAAAAALAALDASLERALVLDRNGYPYLVHPLLDGVPRCPPELVQAWVAWARRQPPAKEATLLLAPEAMGLPLVAPLAVALGLPYVVVRKRKYGLPGEQVAYAETGYGEAALHVNGVERGDKVLVVDNVMSTGGTLGALLATLEAIGAQVVGVLVALDKGAARARLEERHGVGIHAMRTIRVEAGKVRITQRG